MGLSRWLKSRFGGDRPEGMVAFYDVETGRLVQIPASELRPGTVQARVQGIEGLVWISPDQLKQGELRHPKFEKDVLAYIQDIHEAFAEHRLLSLQEWEDGFRRDTDPLREIAMWSHAADIYRAFTGNEPSAERRRGVYRCIIACLTTSPDDVWQVLDLTDLSREEAARVVDRFHGKPA